VKKLTSVLIRFCSVKIFFFRIFFYFRSCKNEEGGKAAFSSVGDSGLPDGMFSNQYILEGLVTEYVGICPYFMTI
jgi:hypothetical protein